MPFFKKKKKIKSPQKRSFLARLQVLPILLPCGKNGKERPLKAVFQARSHAALKVLRTTSGYCFAHWQILTARYYIGLGKKCQAKTTLHILFLVLFLVILFVQFIHRKAKPLSKLTLSSVPNQTDGEISKKWKWKKLVFTLSQCTYLVRQSW